MSYNFKEIQDIILYEIYSHFRYSTQSMSIDRKNIEKLAPRNASRVFTIKAVGSLFSRELIELDNPGLDTYLISEEGIIYIENQLDNEESFINSYVEEKPSNPNVVALPADIDDDWEPLPIDRNAPEYSEAVETLNEAIDVIASNNGYAETEPEERNHIVTTLQHGYRLMTESMPSRSEILSAIVHPLNFMVKKFAESAIGEIAKTAVSKVVTWLLTLL